VKNPKSRTSKTLNMFQCSVRLGLTGTASRRFFCLYSLCADGGQISKGTAIQNNYTEFWTMLDWANPEALGSLKEWTKYVSKPLAIGQSKHSKDFERIRAKVSPVITLYRTVCVIRVCRKSLPSSRTNYFHNISSAGTFFFWFPTTHPPPDLAQLGRRTSSSPR
jgi:hypothetical protein